MTQFAYFGPPGTFTEMALDKFLADASLLSALTGGTASNIDKQPEKSPVATIDAVRSGRAEFACVPIESSLEGSVPATMDALVPDPRAVVPRVQVFAECDLDIAFTIAARPGTAAADVRTIAAYPVASAQVRESIEKLFPGAEFVTATSNAAAAVDAADGRADAAVSTRLAAESSGLGVLADGVCDAADAVTRFLLIGRPSAPLPRTGADRSSVILELANEPGSLMSAMNQFASRGIDLTRIQSRPRRDLERGVTMPGQYRFFLDAVGHVDDAAVAEALQALHRRSERITFLGSWPMGSGGGTPPPDHDADAQWLARIRRGED
ncbi:prephenate dehydratase [Gordonia sp. N1V]|uniref:prephenate dehydratase n=1 Tax=Gordonia sp. N1V TaxID=3034163 RepID=UPI0023E28251|nr:prephenate dehydratase [Gordonia sp. N1V]MDF3281430.1 prephenate dehydratase [Gordonia sp. N1V]